MKIKENEEVTDSRRFIVECSELAKKYNIESYFICAEDSNGEGASCTVGKSDIIKSLRSRLVELEEEHGFADPKHDWSE